jgi:hypothetical protein
MLFYSPVLHFKKSPNHAQWVDFRQRQTEIENIQCAEERWYLNTHP